MKKDFLYSTFRKNVKLKGILHTYTKHTLVPMKELPGTQKCGYSFDAAQI